MATLYIYSFIAGIFAALGVPHFVKGITGERFHGPFGKPVSSITNVFLGWLSFVIAILFLHFSHPWAHLYRASGLFGFAVLIMSLMLATFTAAQPDAKHSK